MLSIQIGLGIGSLFLFLFLVSETREKFPWKLIGIALVSQVIAALVLLKVDFIQTALANLNLAVRTLEDVSTRASSFMFGYLAGGPAPFASIKPESEFIVAFRVLPLIMVVSAISAILYHWRVLPFIISLLARVLVKLFKIPGSLGFGTASCFFLGTIEAPLLIRPYLSKLHRSDFFTLLTCTMATISGSVMVLYAGVIGKTVDNALPHMLTASLISLPAAIAIAKAWIPHTTVTNSEQLELDSPYQNTMEAIIQGSLDGLDMILKISGIIIVLFALVYLSNHLLSLLPFEGLTIERILGLLLAPIMWLIGIPWEEAAIAGELMGSKIVLNEFVAYLKMAEINGLSDRSHLIMTYALCGFANFASVGIVIGGFSTLIPERKSEIIELCSRSLISGNLATLLTGAVVSVIL